MVATDLTEVSGIRQSSIRFSTSLLLDFGDEQRVDDRYPVPMRNRLALPILLTALLAAASCADPDPDRERVIAMIETLRPGMEAALGDSLGPIEVTRVTDSQMKARMLATARAGRPGKLTREEFEARRSEGMDLLAILHPATDVKGNLYFLSLPASEDTLRRRVKEALLHSYQVRTLRVLPFLREASGDEERSLRGSIVSRHRLTVLHRLREALGVERRPIFPGAGSSRVTSLTNRTTRIITLKWKAWNSYLDRYMEQRFPDLAPAQAWKELFADPPHSFEEVTGLSPASGPGLDLAHQASEALWPRLTAGVPARMLPEVIGAQFLTAGPETAARAMQLVTSAFELSAEHPRGFVTIDIFATADEPAARELMGLWLKEERALDEACRSGTEYTALVEARYEEIEVAGCPGTVIRRLEEDRVFLGSGFSEPAWPRPERLVLRCGANLMVVDLFFSLAFPTDTRGIAGMVLGETAAETWPMPPGSDVESLAAGLSDPDPQVRWWSLDGLSEILGDDDPGWEVLAPALREEHPWVLARVLGAIAHWLEGVHYPPDDIRPLILRFCTHADAEVRANAFRCLSNLTSPGVAAEGVVLSAFEDPIVSVRYFALDSWSWGWTEATPPPPAAVPTLLSMARDPHCEVRRLAAVHLRLLGPEAAETVPLLTAALRSEHDELRSGAAKALRSIGDDSPEVIKALRNVFETDFSEDVTEEAWWALKVLTGKSIPWTKRFEE